MIKKGKEKLIAKIIKIQSQILNKKEENWKAVKEILPKLSIAELKEFLQDADEELYYLENLS